MAISRGPRNAPLIAGSRVLLFPIGSPEVIAMRSPHARNNQSRLSQKLLLATKSHQEGKLDRAEHLYRAILAAQPNHFEALYRLGVAHYQRNRKEEALRYMSEAVKLRPGDVAALSNIGLLHTLLGHPAEALASIDRALAIMPNSFGILNNRGNALRDLKRSEEALASYDRALALEPNSAETHNNRGNALRDLKRSEEALTSYDRALALKPDHEEALSNRGAVLRDLNRPEEALVSCDLALAIKPNYVEAHDNKGIILAELGAFKEGAEAIEKAIALVPRRIRSYYNLTLIKRMTVGDPAVMAMAKLAADMNRLAPDEQIELHFALGKTLADIGNREGAFGHWLSGNALKRKQIVYDEGAALSLLERTRAAYPLEMLRSDGAHGEPSTVPVFVIGMPRSGTTLVEQILASHPKAFGAGETDDLQRCMAGLGGGAGAALHTPEAAAQMSDDEFRELGARYIARIRRTAPTAERIVNKALENFRLIGLVHLALPNARIINVRRDPVDVCLSCFSRLFFESLPYAYDLAELGRYYRAHEAMMAHWRSALPPCALLDVQYEEIVADLEGQSRRIIGHCGLEWDARCLDFHQTRRQVRTASAVQVRQPIYSTAVGRSRAYEQFLGPLRGALGLCSPA